jgi:DNA-binding beta-propeller fold protein YncE
MSARYFILFLLLLICSICTRFIWAQTTINSFPSPAGEPRGLAWDGEYLWCADAGTDSVYKLDKSDGSVISSIPFSIGSDYGGLTWGAESNMWIANGPIISELNPANGDVISSFSCPGG